VYQIIKTISDLPGKRAAILGMARSGMAVAKLLRRAGCRVLVSEAGCSEALKTAAAELRAAGIETELSGHSRRTLDGDFLVRSPGVPAKNPFYAEAKQKNFPVFSEIEVASWFCRAPVVAITGSNGKTTTTEWLGDVFRRWSLPVAVCGNVGHPFSAAVEELEPEGVAVVEVSSFQLEDVVNFAPRVAVITNFSPDHLDRYDSYELYLTAKCHLFERLTDREALVYNRGDQELSARIPTAPGRKLSFGLDAPHGPGAGLVGDEIVLVIEGKGSRRLMHRKELSLPGPHNLENALAVICAAADFGVPDEVIVESLRGFPGVAHRLEKVLEANGVLWVNDSKATNIASTLVALESFTRPIILLAGGRDKGSDFEAVAQTVGDKVKTVLLFGEAGAKMEKAWSATFKLERVESLEEAVKRAGELAAPGDVVLLSPMCASFDEFKNYEDRGEKFKAWVHHNAG
jgi:UDP-N-acetylmuramoylalanine--D-glutamate ligase